MKSLLVAAGGIGILFFPSGAEFHGHHFPCHAHVLVIESTPQPIEDHGILYLHVSKLDAFPCTPEEMRGLAHAFHPASHDYLLLFEPDRLGGQGHRLQGRAADFVHSKTADRGRNPAFHRRLLGRRLSDSCGDHVSHDHLIDIFPLDSRTFHSFLDG